MGGGRRDIKKTAPLLTRWAKDIRPDKACPWPEYPRPQLIRPDWLNLNGYWDFAVTPQNAVRERETTDGGVFGRAVQSSLLRGRILVPFPIESVLSGVTQALGSAELLWYRRIFSIPEKWAGKRILLHFGAVDWEAAVLVNGREAGTHRGGYLPFTFDVTRLFHGGENELVVAVRDPTDSSWQQRGKQKLKPGSIWYTAVSGIWQTVWLEPVPDVYIAGLKITPDIDAGAVRVQAAVGGAGGDAGVEVSDGAGLGAGAADGDTVSGKGFKPPRINVRVFDAGALIAEEMASGSPPAITIPISGQKLWSPDSPHLYDLEASIGPDKVRSYFGMRKFGLGKDDRGRTRLCLNNKPLFQFGPLDQGYWPDGLYTPPTDEAMRKDVELVKRLGFNMLRKHLKVEPARYYHYCDRTGLIVWQDMINGGRAVGKATSLFAILFGSRKKDGNYRRAGRGEKASRDDYRRELREMADHLHNFSCIGAWVPFNEGWGQFDAGETAKWLKAYDSTRIIDHASGWFDQGGGDCKSLHVYFKKLSPLKPEDGRAAVLSEFGGYSLRIDGHMWDPSAAFGYKKLASVSELADAYLELLEKELKPCIRAGLSAAIYTQTTDVENEVNGFVTYDREVEKMDFSRVRAANEHVWKSSGK